MWGFYRGSPTIDTAAAINFNLSAMGGIRWVDHTGCAHEPVFGFTWTGESPAMQIAFYRAGHAHASVLTLLTMLLQNRGRLCCDPQFAGLGQSEWELSPHQFWFLPVFFAVAHRPSLGIILYTGAVLVAATALTVGVGLIRSR
jgi:hypothetical protein